MFLYSKWLSLDLPTRMKVAEIFGIVKRGSTHVVDNRIQSDGYNVEEVEAALTPEALRKYMMSNEKDAEVLWDAFIARIEGREVEGGTQAPPPAEIVKKAGTTMSVLPKEEAEQFKKEHKARVAKTKKKALPVKTKANVTKRTTKKK